jgi:16S rRNA (cytidine1402-2'-O)-methyltransferase
LWREKIVAGTLRVVATPIGNLGDLSPRAAAALRDADLVLAEDTRRTGKLLRHVGSDTPQLSLHEHNERERVDQVLDRLRSGAAVVLVSDAGTPAVSDPGYRLLAACVAAGMRVEPIPGPSAALAALVASGLPTDRVAFEGFLPRKGAARRRRLQELATEPRTIVLFVSPHRAAADLVDLATALGADRPAAVARELTKLHEQTLHGPLGELAERASDGLRGEVTVVIAGAEPPETSARTDADLVREVQTLGAEGATKKDAIAEVAARSGVPKREVYQAVVDAGS